MANTKRIYEEVWSHDEYRQVCHGLKLYEEHRELFPEEFKTVIDLGCGMGWLVQRLVTDGYDAYGVDIAKNSMDDEMKALLEGRIWHQDLRRGMYRGVGPDNGRFDLGVCCDVMEHINERDVLAVLSNIWSVCDEVIFVIANHASEFLGHNLHPTTKAPEWWWRQMLAIDADSRVSVKDFSRPGRAGVFSITWKRG